MDHYYEYLDFFLSKEVRSSFYLNDGEGCVMVSAPHSVEQTRENKIKYGEYHTGILAKMLNDDLNCPVIYKTYNMGDDANYDERSPYKDALKKYVIQHHIKYLLDLHQLAPQRNVNIDLGTGLGKNISPSPEILEIAKKNFHYSFSNVTIDTPFDASYPFTVSSFIYKECGISCLQIEINSRLLCDEYDDFSFDIILSTLRRIINELNNRR